jgi:hypothetical protein
MGSPTGASLGRRRTDSSRESHASPGRVGKPRDIREAVQVDCLPGGSAREVHWLNWRDAATGEPCDAETVTHGSERDGGKRASHGTSPAVYSTSWLRSSHSTQRTGVMPRARGRGTGDGVLTGEGTGREMRKSCSMLEERNLVTREPDAVKAARPVCAVRRFEIFLSQTGGPREVFLSYQLTLRRKPTGTTACVGKRCMLEGVVEHGIRMARPLWVRLACLNSNLDLVKVRAHRKNAWNRCHILHWLEPLASVLASV